MRLLQFDADSKFSMTEFFEPDIPNYAVLSHTWGEDNDEVTIDDIKNGSGNDKKGYKKILFCRNQARQDGLQYFWIDTCYIDKTNNAELSRSLNSMFRWYRNAAQCYVYLTDVSSSPAVAHDEHGPKPFRQSRWFTRGWTLQELLAPASVTFFSREGRRLGDKCSLGTQICEITNIPPTALRIHSFSRFGVDERLRWIEPRQTKLFATSTSGPSSHDANWQ